MPVDNRAKRYERMMRAHGITPTAVTVKPPSSRAPKPERRDSKSQLHKKRKTSAFTEENTAADDEENFSRVKPDPATEKKQLNIKEETGQLTLDEAANLMQYYATPPYDPSAVGSEVYSQAEYSSGPVNYQSAISTSYGLPEQQPYEFSFDPTTMNNASAALGHGIHYQPMLHYSSTGNQGGSESPLIVD